MPKPQRFFAHWRKHGGFELIWFGVLMTIVMEMRPICVFPGIATVLANLAMGAK